tara:strand:- start:862 stop:2118 length:1257 start_codon:yes stop_codon:yes gene_type:complete
MAIVKCNEEIEEPASLPPLDEEVNDSSGEHYYEDHVKIGKKLIAVEHDFFTEEITADLPEYDIQAPFLIATRPAGIKDTIRAELGKFWVQETDDKESRMMFRGEMDGFSFGYNIFDIVHEAPVLVETSLNIEEHQQKWILSPNPDLWGDTEDGVPSDVWTAYWQGGSTQMTDGFSRPSPLIPDGKTFTDHAFEMITPFSKEELEMFANFSGDIEIADIASDYDFFAKAYEEGIASTTVPENALPHLYAEIQRGESEVENTIIRDLTTADTQVKEGYFRQWINSVLSSPDEMSKIAENYENVAILDSVVSEDFILDSEIQTTSAFETLMAYANRENLFPMNVNIEVGTNEASILMEGAESAEMVDDIVRLLMGEGQVIDTAPLGQDGESSSSAEESTEDESRGMGGGNAMQRTTEEEEE